MTNIEICVIGRKTHDFTEHLAAIRHIEGLKVLKRRNKPFYDITGAVKSDDDFALMGQALSYLIMNCGAELEINDKALQDRIFKII